MFSLLFNCCGGPKTVDVFEQTRLACTKPNWQVPHKDNLTKIIEIMNSQESQTDNSIQLNSLLAHLQQDEERKNVAFVLKNLIILDMMVEQRMFLNKISHYTNNQLIYMEPEGSNNRFSTAIKDLIGSYYIYIKQKAKYYQLQAKQMIDQNQRQNFMQKSNSITILNQINICFKIQNLILDASSKYKNGDKSNELIQYIFTLIFKTYLFCHSIVAISLKVFVKKIPQLTKHDLKYIRKLIIEYNQNYIKNFTNFIVVNKQIPVYKQFQAKQIIKSQQKIIQLIDIQLKQLQLNSQIIPEVEEIPKVEVNKQQPIVLNKLNTGLTIDNLKNQIKEINGFTHDSGQPKNTQENIITQKQKIQEDDKKQVISNQITQIEPKKEDQRQKNVINKQNQQKNNQNEVNQIKNFQQPVQNHKQQTPLIQIQKIQERIQQAIKQELEKLPQNVNQPDKKTNLQNQNITQTPKTERIQKQQLIQNIKPTQSNIASEIIQNQHNIQIKQPQNQKNQLNEQKRIQIPLKNEQANQKVIKEQQKQQPQPQKLQDNKPISISNNETKQQAQNKKIQQSQNEQISLKQQINVMEQQNDKQSQFFIKYTNTYYQPDWYQMYKQDQSIKQNPQHIMTPFQIAQFYNWNVSPEQENEQEEEQQQQQQDNQEQQEQQQQQQQQINNQQKE